MKEKRNICHYEDTVDLGWNGGREGETRGGRAGKHAESRMGATTTGERTMLSDNGEGKSMKDARGARWGGVEGGALTPIHSPTPTYAHPRCVKTRTHESEEGEAENLKTPKSENMIT